MLFLSVRLRDNPWLRLEWLRGLLLPAVRSAFGACHHPVADDLQGTGEKVSLTVPYSVGASVGAV